MHGTCKTCGSALHSDLSRAHGRCGPCRAGEDQAAPPEWTRHFSTAPAPAEQRQEPRANTK